MIFLFNLNLDFFIFFMVVEKKIHLFVFYLLKERRFSLNIFKIIHKEDILARFNAILF